MNAYNTALLERDFTPTGIEMIGAYENDRNSCYSSLYKDIIREVFGVQDVICGHHLVYQTEEHLTDPNTGPYTPTRSFRSYQVPTG